MWSLQALKLDCLLALATLPLLCGLLPALLFRLREAAVNGASRSGRSILSCAAGGVFMAACLLDVVPDSLADLRDELRRQSISVPEGGSSPGRRPAKPHSLQAPYVLGTRNGPVAEGRRGSGRLSLHSRGGSLEVAADPRGPAGTPLVDLGRAPAFPAPELVLGLGFLLVLVLEHVMLDCSDRPGAESTPLLGRQEAAVVEQRAETVLSPFRSLVLVVSLSLHSAFEGLALGLQDTPSQVLRLAAAIVLHKCIIAASLGLLLLQSRLALPWLAAALACFALMSPVGVGVGMAVPRGAGGSLARSVLEGVAAGTFLYITFLEILPQELHLPSGRLPKVLALLLGFSGMAGLRFLG